MQPQTSQNREQGGEKSALPALIYAGTNNANIQIEYNICLKVAPAKKAVGIIFSWHNLIQSGPSMQLEL